MKVSAITLLLSSTSAITLKQLAEIRESTQACTLVAGSDPAVYKNNGVVCTPSGLAQSAWTHWFLKVPPLIKKLKLNNDQLLNKANKHAEFDNYDWFLIINL